MGKIIATIKFENFKISITENASEYLIKAFSKALDSRLGKGEK